VEAKPHQHASRRHFVSNHETLIFAAKTPEARPFFNHDLMREWRKNYFQHLDCPSCGKPVRMEVTHMVGEQMGASGYPHHDWREKTFGYHPTQKPFELLLRIVYASSREGDLVLDPFCGTGTTGLAAYKNGRRFIGIDFTESYCEITVRRFEQLRKQLAAQREPDFKPAA